MQELERIEGTVENVIFRNKETGYAVLEIESDGELITAVGELSGLYEGEHVTLHGYFREHSSFGMQFRTEAYESDLPETVGAVRRYLASGALPHIGPAMAQKIVDAFGADTLEVLATDQERLGKLKGFSLRKAKEVQAEFQNIFGVKEAIAYLNSLGLSAAAAVALYRHYGPDTVSMISENPYLLCGYPAQLPFEQVDRIAGERCMEYDSDERVEAGILHILRHNLQNGHSCLPRAKLIPTAAGFLRLEPDRVEERLSNLVEQETLAFDEETDMIFLPDLYRAERDIAFELRSRATAPVAEDSAANHCIDRIEISNGITYAPLQRDAIRAALKYRVLVLTGGPGTGKTTAVNGMIEAFEQQGDRVALTAPTGRAAKRLAELTGRKASTIHRLLEVDYNDSGLVRFLHNEKNKLRCDAVIIDEMSMVDSVLFESLLRALRPSCRIIMVGDEDQLPSVGAGNVLGSIISSGVVPCVRLKEIFRQAAESSIVSNAHRIVSGQDIIPGGFEDDFFFLEEHDSDACVRLICDLVARRLPAAYGYDPAEDIQVLCPSRIGPLGTQALNAALQQRVNPPAEGKPQMELRERVFRTGDKVMQVRNNYDIPYTGADGKEDGAGAFNGDMGIVERVNPRDGTVCVRSEDRYFVYPREHLRELETAYAVSIHKAQGSEFPAVIIPLLDVPPKLCYRNLLYTGVTRARNLCILVGSRAQAAAMIANAKRNLRFCGLADFLRRKDL